MKIAHIHIRNFRKLRNCRIDFDEKQTIFVGANNSGKTSAMSAIVWFLKYKDRFTTREFTLTNWKEINKIGDSWIEKENDDETLLELSQWDSLVPSLDLWITVPEDEAYRVYKIIPSLDWKQDLVGVRLRFEPKDIKALYSDYKTEALKAKQLMSCEEYKSTDNLKLYPEHLWDFLSQKGNLNKYFAIKYYVLDSEKISDSETDTTIQRTPSIALDADPLSELIKIDSIEAYRDFTDPEGKNERDIDTLSKQLQEYYKINNGDEAIVSSGDLKLMDDMAKATKTFDEKLEKSFKSPISELQNINYPGFQNPDIRVKSVINIIDSITHESSVQFAIQGKDELSLPEKYNGLGLRNLISMYLKLVQFREQWTHPNDKAKEDTTIIEPIHLVFIEEPEAHLHAQAQQVFIRKALDALTNSEENDVLKNNPNLTTQLVVTTHSNHIVNEIDMNCLRYFRRVIDNTIGIPVSTVVNLSRAFGEDEKETRFFVSRYIRLTHCDIFFADAAILVEGAAERILMPKFLRNEKLDNYYISIIEVNGSHAHRFKSLIEKLSIPTLIITDLDAQKETTDALENKHYKACLPSRGDGQTTNNDTIKKWLVDTENIDKLLDLSSDEKIINKVRIAYQTGISLADDSTNEEIIVYPYTFEDALIFTNLWIFQSDKKIQGKGPVTTFYNYQRKSESIKDFHNRVFNKLENSSGIKAEFANILLLDEDFDRICTPDYIKEGLAWLKGELNN